ncbi:MAG: hypothetical protein PF483_06195 [Halothiobacillus sp.]|jgi:hypothetical protein|nr:hypothetical protein [Halothiobacillus sp.]
MNKFDREQVCVDAALNLLPPLLRDSLLHDKNFLTRWHVMTATSITFEDGPTFQRYQLYDGVRTAIREIESQIPITDSEGAAWELSVRPKTQGLAFTLRSADKNIPLMDYSALAEDSNIRLAWFDNVAREINLEDDFFHQWRARMKGAPLGDNDFAELTEEIESVPVSVFQRIKMSLRQGGADIETLVPFRRDYYGHLVGFLGSASDVHGYVDVGVVPLVDRLRKWNSVKGFLLSLLACSTSDISETIPIDHLSRSELTHIYERLVDYGDPISQIGAIEVALNNLNKYPELEQFAEKMIKNFVALTPENDSSHFTLLSAMIMMVASELVKKRTFKDAPPFYRKQAAIAHASLIIRAIYESSINPVNVLQWVNENNPGHIFYLQGLVDLRAEPRWLPDFICAEQLHAEFIGRIRNSVGKNKDKIRSMTLDKVLPEAEPDVAGIKLLFNSMLPGPLEGAIFPRLPVPEYIQEEITATLTAERLESNSFALLVNTALHFNISENQAGLAAEALRRVKYSIENSCVETRPVELIEGLAVLAAVTRATGLADELRVLMRVMRRSNRFTETPDNEIRIAMVAAASHEDIEKWALFSGEWMTEIAFQCSDKELAKNSLLQLRRLVQIEPALARHFARADAALAAFSG